MKFTCLIMVMSLTLLVHPFRVYAEERISPVNKDYNFKFLFYDAYNSIGFGNNSDYETVYSWLPNSGIYYGLDISIKGFGFKTLLKSLTPAYDPALFGKTDFNSFSVYWLGKRHSFEGYYYKQKGFYLDDTENLTAAEDHNKCIIRDDLELINAGFYYYFIFSPDSFSMRAAFNQSEIQTRSGGSFAFIANPNYNSIEAKSSLIEKAYSSEFEKEGGFCSGRFYSLPVLPGFFYTFTMFNFFVTPSFFLGASPTWGEYDDNGKKSEFDISLSTIMKLAVGYNSPGLYGGMDLSATGLSEELDNTYLFIFYSSLNFYVGTRF